MRRRLTWIVQRVAQEDMSQQAATAAHIEELRSQLVRLTDMVAAQSTIRTDTSTQQRVGQCRQGNPKSSARLQFPGRWCQ